MIRPGPAVTARSTNAPAPPTWATGTGPGAVEVREPVGVLARPGADDEHPARMQVVPGGRAGDQDVAELVGGRHGAAIDEDHAVTGHRGEHHGSDEDRCDDGAGQPAQDPIAPSR